MSDLMTAEDVSKRTKIPIRTLSQWRYLGKGPAYIRLGNHVRYRPEAIDEWETASEVPFSGAA